MRDTKLLFPSSVDQNNMWKQRRGTLALKSAQILRASCLGIKEKAFGKNVTQLPKTISILTRRRGSCPSVGPSKSPPDYTCHDYGRHYCRLRSDANQI